MLLPTWHRALCLSCLLLAAGPAAGAARRVRLDELIRDTQQMRQEKGHISVVWWIPEAFWKTGLGRVEGVTAKQVEDFVKPLRPYVLVAVVAGRIDPFGEIDYSGEAEVRESARIVGDGGKEVAPAAPGDVKTGATELLGSIRPAISKAIGPMGKHVHFLLFPAKDLDSPPRAEGKGTFKFKFGKDVFRWRLPLNASVAPAVCPDCGEKVSGSYRYCPWCGAELPAADKRGKK
jgi:hypothetical protein